MILPVGSVIKPSA